MVNVNNSVIIPVTIQPLHVVILVLITLLVKVIKTTDLYDHIYTFCTPQKKKFPHRVSLGCVLLECFVKAVC